MTALGTASVIRGNSRHLPLADNSVDLVVTSPPYFALRSYQDGGEHYAGQIGDEPTPAEFVASLLDVTRECVRVLKPSGSLWVNLGDKYSATSTPGPQSHNSTMTGGRHKGVDHLLPRRLSPGAPPKSLIGIPWRYALACIDDLGLILRAEVVWSKPNGLPESVTDRVRRSHEQWFYFEQSRGEVVEPGAQGLPLCSLCGRPADSRASLVARLHELNPSVKDGDLPDEVGADQRVERERGLRAEQPGVVGLGGSTVPLAVPGDADVVEDAADLLNDGQVSVVDQDAEVRATGAAVAERDGPLPVNDSSEPGEVCRCSHPFILDDEPWIPQTLAAELMQMVADGEADAQHVADFLSGNYARTHSTWFHFTLSPRYFSAVDEIREPHEHGGHGSTKGERLAAGQAIRGLMNNGAMGSDNRMAGNPLGKLPGSVWTIPTEPLKVPAHLGIDHFAAFPHEWPKRIIQGWSPAGVCVACGEGRRPVVASVGLDMTRPQARRAQEIADRSGLTEAHFEALLSVGVSDTGRGKATQSGTGKNTAEVYALADEARASLGGYAREYLLRRPTGFTYACACPAPLIEQEITEFDYEAEAMVTRTVEVPDPTWVNPAPTTPAVVLDPFGGTGTTAMVAKALGRHGITVDMSADYCRLAEWRTQDRNQLAKVLGHAKTDAPDPDQLDLFGGDAA